jgi:hypothetical protein
MALQELVIPTKDVDMYVNVNGNPIKIDTGARFTRGYAQTLENIFAISHSDPIAVASTNANYNLSIALQSGEYHTILDAINGSLTAGTPLYASWLQIPSFTFTVSWHMKNMVVPRTVSISFFNCQVSEDSEDDSANDAQTLVNISMQGTGIKRDVYPI